MNSTSDSQPVLRPSRVVDLQRERQRRAARRMALQTIAVLGAYARLQQSQRQGGGLYGAEHDR